MSGRPLFRSAWPQASFIPSAQDCIEDMNAQLIDAGLPLYDDHLHNPIIHLSMIVTNLLLRVKNLEGVKNE